MKTLAAISFSIILLSTFASCERTVTEKTVVKEPTHTTVIKVPVPEPSNPGVEFKVNTDNGGTVEVQGNTK